MILEHNIGKFGSRWKLLGVGGSVPIGRPTNPNRGFYHPPESIIVEKKGSALGKKSVSAVVVSIPARTTYDLWAYGVVLYEAVAGVPLGPYACRGKRAMSSAEVGKIGQWDEHSLKKALRHLDEEDAATRDLVKNLLHFDSEKRYQTMRQVLEHPFFGDSSKSKSKRSQGRHPNDLTVPQATSTRSLTNSSPSVESPRRSSTATRRSHKTRDSINTEQKSVSGLHSQNYDENIENGVEGRPSYGGTTINSGRSSRQNRESDFTSRASTTTSKKSRMFGSFRRRGKGEK